MHASPHQLTELLNQWGKGDATALEQVLPLVYAELHRIARRHMRQQRQEHTLQTTALINEAYLRIAGGGSGKHWRSRAHFFGVAVKAMRQVLVDHARAKHAAKRGGGWQVIPLEEGIAITDERLAGLIALDEALIRLARLHTRQSQVVELRFFGGLSVEDTAHLLKISAETVMLDWRAAKAWLHKELSRNDT